MPLKQQALSGIFWTFLQQFWVQGISFMISIILARLLMPEEFGLIAMIGIFMGVGGILMDGGLGESLIRTKDPDQEDFSTVFFFNLAGSIIVYGIVYFAAPLIAAFFEREILIDITRLYCLIFIFNGFSAVQVIRLTKKMDFKTQLFVKIPSLILSSAVGIYMAYSGYGVWSLVWMALIQSFAQSVQLWFWSKWKPSWVFNMEKFKYHFNFGIKLTLSGLLEVIFLNAYTIIIGKFFTATQLGYYGRASSLKQFPVNNIGAILGKVTYPLFASIQDDDVRLKRVYKQLIQMVVFILAPVLIFLGVLAEPTFRFLFTEKWLPAVPYFQILCVTGILFPIHSYNLNVLKVKGRTDLILKLQIIKKVQVVLVILVSIQFGIYGLLYGQVFLSLSVFFINAFYTNRFINYSAWEQTKDITPIIFTAAIAGLMVYIEDYYLNSNFDILRILIGGTLGVISYLILCKLFRIDSLNYFKNLINSIRKKKNKNKGT